MLRRRATVTLMVLVALWPVVPLVLQSLWQVDPWKLMAFGMYAVPARRLSDYSVKVAAKQNGRWHAVDAASCQRELDDFLKWHRTFGALVGPERLAEALRVRMHAEVVEVEVARPVLNPATAHIELRIETGVSALSFRAR